MNEETSVVYGGSFNPPTKGHYHIIKKAATIFDKVYVVQANNIAKSSMFTDEEKFAMLQDMALQIDPTGEIVQVKVLPPTVYLANFAYDLRAKFLVRGIRDQMDFGYEQTIYRTNRRIQHNVETIYLMPDDAYSLVSSSWVKSLIGCKGWTNVIKDCVTPFVLNELKKHYLKEKFYDLVNSPPLDHVLRGNDDSAWEAIVKGYGDKEFHGYGHLVNVLELLNTHVTNPDPFMEYALFMHDVDPDEEKSAEIATSFMRMVSFKLDVEDDKAKVERLIMATKHDSCEYDRDDEKIIATVDLLTLALPSVEYGEYCSRLLKEYHKASKMSKIKFLPIWEKGRAAFLEKMLSRRIIFPWGQFAAYNELAIRNMKRELNILKGTNILDDTKD